MNQKSVELLEFPTVFSELCSYCFCDRGRLVLEEAPFLSNRGAYDYLQRGVSLLMRMEEEYKQLPSLSFPPPEPILKEASRKGSYIDGELLYQLALYLRSARELSNWLSAGLEAVGEKIDPEKPEAQGEETEIHAIFRLLDPPDELGRAIFAVLEADGSIKENHPELKSIRQKLGRARRDLLSESGRFIQENRQMYQTDVPTQKDGRTVLPLKANYRGNIDGIVHDVSSKGATLFVEPPAIVQKNNDVALMEHELRLIVIRILKELTGKVREQLEPLQLLHEQIGDFDAYQARCRYSKKIKGIHPEISIQGLTLKKARHPLLGKEAVPIDIVIGEKTRSLIISGPNAGGKTVSLKTIGLLALMNQFGLAIPVEEGSFLPLFRSIRADIGDDQSIEASLSTFSGHMNTIAGILNEADSDTLVLLDELGSGTDPAEGSVIAMAILESLLERNALTVTTSHHGLLKNFGYTRKGARNASMDFDESSHRPTYRVIEGLPGESHAFDMAESSGIPEEVLHRAREYREKESGDAGTMIRELEKETARLRREQELFRGKEKQLKEDIREQQLKALSLRQKEQELRRKGFGSLESFLSETRKDLENLVRELREGEINRSKTKRVKEFISGLEERVSREEADLASQSERIDDQRRQLSLEKEEASEPLPGKADFKKGDTVYVETYKKEGTLIRKDKQQKWLVGIGPMKVTLEEKSLRPVGRGKKSSSEGVSVSYSAPAGKQSALFSIDLRGLRLEEALERLELQIDAAIVQGLQEFSVIHGTGEGILQKGVWDLLGKRGEIASYEWAHPEQGGAGKTVVTL
jgi:DNA mismatch repair protein MutS2